MLEKYALFRVLRIFMEEPYKELYLREAAGKAGVGTGTAKACLDWLVERGFLSLEKKGNLCLFKGNFKGALFRHFKIAFNMLEIKESGLLDSLDGIEGGASIVLYGSFARGENDSKSDIDILMVAPDTRPLDTGKYSKRLGREINMISFTPSEWKRKAGKDRPFYERIIMDGIALAGDIPVVR